MAEIGTPIKAAWLNASHEMPQPNPPGKVPPLWCENYLSYLWSPANQIGIFIHLCRKPGPIPLWDEQVIVALPGDRYLLAKGFSAGRVEKNAFSISGITYRCDEPFVQWTKRFHGGVRLLDGDEYRAGPLKDNIHLPAEFEFTCQAMSPPFDYGEMTTEESESCGFYGHSGHYEQHYEMSGYLNFQGKRYELAGTGMRDHSWGNRDYAVVGCSTWYHGQFPQSGRSFMVVNVTGLPPKSPFNHAVVCDRHTATKAQAIGVQAAKSREDCDADYEFQLVSKDGKSTIRAQILNPPRTSLMGTAEIGLGTFSSAEANHHYVNAFTRFEWDGEVGYGLSDRSFDIQVR